MEAHSIVIGDTHTISDLPAYIAYWWVSVLVYDQKSNFHTILV